MCVIIIKQQGKKVSREIAKTSARINPHGLGVIWLDTFEITYHKSKDYKVLDTDRPFIAHFRYATIGAIGKENTHPFMCGKNKHELLMMNGTIKGLGNAKICDSKVLAINLGNIDRHKWKYELSKYDCRFVTVNVRNRTFQIYNKENWFQKDGVWYSKDNVLETNLVAVHGTLKKGFSNYYSYLYGANHIGNGKTKEKYPLIVKGLPYLIEERGKGFNVEVDVFKVSDSRLSNLDKLEGHPNWYCRKQIEVVVKDKTLLCWVYFNIREVSAGNEFHASYVHKPIITNFFNDSVGYNRFDYTNRYVINNGTDDLENCCSNDADYEDTFFNAEFSIDEENPMCMDCFHDLEHDGFANYYCSGCNGWFTEDEVVKFQR